WRGRLGRPGQRSAPYPGTYRAHVRGGVSRLPAVPIRGPEAHQSTGSPYAPGGTARGRIRGVVPERFAGRDRRADAFVRIRKLRPPRPSGGDSGKRGAERMKI